MVNLTSIQVVSNAPEGLSLQIDGIDIRIKSPDEASTSLPSLFLLSTSAKPNKDVDLLLEGWVDATKNFIESYQSLESFGAMLTVQMLELSPVQSVEMVNECLELAEPFQKISISVLEQDSLRDLVLDARLRSELSSLLVLEEAIATCTPLKNQEALEQDALRSLSMNAACSLNSIYSPAKDAKSSLNTANENDDKIEVLTRENELLLLQLHQVQEELERYFIALKELENQQDEETILEKLARTAPLDRKSVSSYFGVLFDASYYRQQVGQKRFALLNYKYVGWKRGVDPHPLFDTEYYLEQIGISLSDMKMSPLMHYLRYGSRLNLSAHREFDTAWYKRQNADVVASAFPMLVHFLAFGWQEGRNPNPNFDCNWYLEQYPDVAAVGMNPLVHFVLHGRAEGRKSNASA